MADNNLAKFSRFKDAPWFPRDTDINILVGGAGGIGSWLTLMLARIGYKPYVYDFDVLEEINLGGQLYPKSKVGMHKVDALVEIVRDFSEEEISVFNERLDADTMSCNIVMSAFDNLLARKHMFESWVTNYGDDPNAIFIDGRLTMENLTIFCINGGNSLRINSYRTDFLWDDSEVEEAPCTMKQSSHGAAMIASHMVAFLTNFIGSNQMIMSSSIPFYWDYFISANLITENIEPNV